VLDANDACPTEAGGNNADGCPSKDQDNDGIVDSKDRCPTEAEDVDNFQDEDGCPEVDNDADGIVDAADRCPNEAGPVENRGCPDTDRDKDSLVDRLDNCPDEPGPVKNRGCKEKQQVSIAGDKLVILDKVFFDTNKSTIQKRSLPLLRQVARVLSGQPRITKLRVEGHTDSQGDDGKNMTLSQARAEAVRAFLISEGIAPERLDSQGYGEEKPISTNASAKGRADNRRVEFVIVEQ